MIYERMEPLTPIRDPTVVNRGLSNMNPVVTDSERLSPRGGLVKKLTFGNKCETGISIQNGDHHS